MKSIAQKGTLKKKGTACISSTSFPHSKSSFTSSLTFSSIPLAPHATKDGASVTFGASNISQEPEAFSLRDSENREDNQSDVLLTSGKLKSYYSFMKPHEFSNAQEITISAGSFVETIVSQEQPATADGAVNLRASVEA